MYCLGYTRAAENSVRLPPPAFTASCTQFNSRTAPSVDLLHRLAIYAPTVHIIVFHRFFCPVIMSHEDHLSSPASHEPVAPDTDAVPPASSEPFSVICQRVHADAVVAAQAAIAAAADDASARQVPFVRS
jgi:hypothetical protein